MENSGLRILIVDDDHITRRILGAFIKQSGHEVIEAGNGRKGLAKALALHPDVVIAQHALPTMSGVELARRIRRTPDEHRPYIVLVTSPGDHDNLMDAFAAGVDEFIDKPVRMEIVSAQLPAWQRITRLQRENERYMRELQQYSRELTCSNLRIRELAMTDDLTGLPNRRCAMEHMQHEWSAADRETRALSCMVIDLDGLKQINDEQGLERGDVVLKTVAAIMKKYLPSQDIVCRISGDEFLVICPGASLDAALACGEKLVGLIGSFNIHAEGYPLGLSIGVAERRAGIDGPQELISLAEQAMHYAKRAGKNQVCPGQGAGLRVVREAGKTAKPGGAKARKAKKQLRLWHQADVLGAVA